MTNTIPIHTSDRIAFKRCRRSWDWSSRIRQNYTSNKIVMPLNFGSAIHGALEVWYEPTTWAGVKDGSIAAAVEGLAIKRFKDLMREFKQNHLKRTGQEALDDELQTEYLNHLVLGEGMLKNYFKYSRRKDKFTVIAVEQKFEVLLFRLDDGTEVVYRGRLDMLVMDEYGFYWIWDHKTAARLEDNLFFLTLDEQVSSYIWALSLMKGIEIKGVVYNELYKGVAGPPQRLQTQRKGCVYSVSKSQDTTYEMYIETLDKEGLDHGPYLEILEYLKENAPEYVRRTQIVRSKKEQIRLGQQIVREAYDMVDPELAIYPNPNKWSCKWCDFKAACIIANEGGDVEWILENNFHKDKDKIVIEDVVTYE